MGKKNRERFMMVADNTRHQSRRVIKWPGVFKKLCKRAAENDPILRSLELRGFQLGEDGAFDLAQSLRANGNISEINLWLNHIGDEGAVALSEVLQRNKAVTRLDLFENDIADVGASALADALVRNSTISELSLHTNQVGDMGAIELARAISTNRSLTSVSLHNNDIGNKGLMALAAAMETNTTLRELVLTDNSATNNEPLERINASLMRNQDTVRSEAVEALHDALVEDDSYPIHSPSQRADLRLLADCVRSDAHSHIVHTQLMLDMVDQSPSRVDKVPDVARIRTPVTSDLSVCDVEQRVLYHAASPINETKG